MRTLFARRALLLLFLPCLALMVAARQPVGRLTLKPASGTHPEEFSSVSSIRELADGRVIATDGREQRLLVLDFASGAAREIGRKGKGPGEYSMVAQLRALGSDSSLLGDFMNRRWLLLHRDSIVVTVPPDDRAVALTEALSSGADDRGNVMREFSPERANGTTVTDDRDSNAVVLVSRRTAKADTIAWIRNVERRIEMQRGPEGRITSMSTMTAGPLRTGEQALLFADGWLAVARLEPFRIDWRSPQGAWTLGASLPVARIRVDRREIAAYDARQAASAAAAGPRPPGAPTFDPGRDFPDFVPPLVLGGLIAGPQGLLIIRRPKSADFPDWHYLVVDRRGRLLGQIDLPATEQIVGSGPRTLYVTVRDEDDILRLRRHPW